MKKTVSIKVNNHFKYLYAKGSTIVCPYFILYYKKNNKNIRQLGITVSKKIGNAVVRNRAKRVLKEAYRLLELQIKNGYDFVLVSRSKTPAVSSVIIKNDLFYALKKKELLDSGS